MKTKITSFFALFLFFCSSWISAQEWESVGPNDFDQLSYGPTDYTDMAIANDGTIYVVFQDRANDWKASVKKFDGSVWKNVGAPGFSSGVVFYTSIAIDGSGIPYVVYKDGFNGPATVQKFDGSNWEVLGVEGFTAGSVNNTTIAIDNLGFPYVLYQDEANSYKATVQKYNGTDWQLVGIGEVSEDYSSNFSLAIDNVGTPYVFLPDSGLEGKGTVKFFDGNAWQILGTGGFSSNAVYFTDIAIDGSGTPYVSYQDGYNSFLTVQKFNGTSWEVVERENFSDAQATNTSIFIGINNLPYVLYKSYNNLIVQQFNGSNWEIMGVPILATASDTGTSLVIDGLGVPVVAFTDQGINNKPTVQKFDGVKWQIISAPSIGQGGSSNSPSLALTNSGIPYVAFLDDSNSSNASVKKYNDTSWQNVSSFAISLEYVWSVSLAMDGQDVPYVAYYEGGATVKKFDGTNWQLVGSERFATGFPTIAVSDSGTPYVLYADGNEGKATVRRFDGNDWQLVGDAEFSEGQIFQPTIKLDSQGTLYVAYSFNGSLVVQKFNGTIWVNLGSEAIGSAYNPSLFLDDNDIPYIAYADQSVGSRATVKKFDGTEWQLLGAAGFTQVYNSISIAVDQTGIPYILYDGGSKKKFSVQKFEGTNWQIVGAEDFSAGEGYFSDIAMDRSGNIFAMYSSPEIFVKKFSTGVVSDNEKPVITCPLDLSLNVDSLCEANSTIAQPTATDNFSAIFSFEGSRDDGLLLSDPFPIGATTITWTATDEAGNVSESCDQLVNVSDTEVPTVVCKDITVQLDDEGKASIVAADIDGGSTDNCTIASITVDVENFYVNQVGPNPVILTVRDINGNINTCTATVTVEDNIAPTAVCKNVTVQLDDNGNATLQGEDLDNGSSDAAGVAGLVLSASTFTCADLGDNVVFLTVTDTNGNESSCSATVTVENTIKPEITCPADISLYSSNGSPLVIENLMAATAQGNCGGAITMVGVRSDGEALTEPFPVGNTSIQWTAKDAQGNSNDCIQEIFVNFTASSDKDIVAFSFTEEIAPASIDATAKTVDITVATGTNVTALVPSIGISPDAGINPASGVPQNFTAPIDYVVIAQDGTDQIWTITVNVASDTEAPTMTCLTNITQSAGSNCSITMAIGEPTATDNVSTDFTFEGIRSDSAALDAPFPIGNTTIMWTATDEAGNVSETCDQLVTVTGTGDCWVQQGLDINGEMAGDLSGRGVSLNADGTRIAIGARQNAGNGTNAGHVRVFEIVNGSWIQLGSDIDGGAPEERIGFTLAMNAIGNRVVVGVSGMSGNGERSGGFRVYEYNGSDWAQLGGDVYGETLWDSLSSFAITMNASGNRVAAGSIANDGNGVDAGHVRIYELIGGNWSQLGADIDGEAEGDQSGRAVSLSADGSRVAIGAFRNDGNGADSGHVRIFNFDGANWNQVGQDIDGEAAGDWMGQSVSLSDDGNLLAIGASTNGGNGESSGQVRIYEFNGTTWNQRGGDIDGDAAGDQAGYSVKLSGSGSRVAIGSLGSSSAVNQAGQARVFEYNLGSWVLLGNKIAGEKVGDQAGAEVSFSKDGQRLAVGGIYNDGNGEDSGHVRLFKYTGPGEDSQAPVIICPNIITGVSSGGAITISLLNPTATDNVSGNFTFEGTRSDNLPLTDPFTLGDTMISWTATDEAGNTSDSCNQIVTIGLAETEIILDNTGALNILDVNGGSSDDVFTLTLSGDNLRIVNTVNFIKISGDGVVQMDENTVEIPLSIITNGITLNGEGGTNTVNIDTALNLSGPDNFLTLNNINSVITGGGNLQVNALNVNNGNYDTNGAITTVVTVANFDNWATLSGNGRIVGDVNINNSAILGPGTSSGILGTGNLNLEVGAIFNAEVNGPIPGTDYDQLSVIGSVEINNASLNLIGGYANASTDIIVLIANDGSDIVQGTFLDFPEGAAVAFGTFTGIISYKGGDDNDVVLKRETTKVDGFALRINTGGPESTYGGNVFVADQYFDTGKTLVRPQTGLPEPYQSFRYSPSQQMAYDIPLPDGTYTVNLYFAELWFGATGGVPGGAGKRVFDVRVEGQLVEDDLDVFAEVGAERMLVRTHTVNVTGGVLDIDFSSLAVDGGVRHPTINAIEVLGSNEVENPFIWVSETSLPTFNSEPGTPTMEQSYTVSGGNLTADIELVAPTDFEVSTTSGSGFGSSLTLAQSGGTVAATTIYVRFNRATVGPSTGNIVHTSAFATSQNVFVSGDAGSFALRINTGGPESTYGGNVFVADQYFDTGKTLVRPQTGLPEPYQSFRYSPSQQMAYDIPLPDGTYTVNLYFAELWFGATGGVPGGAGKRVFDVRVEGQLVEDNLDIFSVVGAERMLVRTHTVNVTGGVLDIDFSSLAVDGGVRHPTINAIEVLGSNEVENPFIWVSETSLPTFNSEPGTPTMEQSYTVSGGNLTADIELVAPTDFEVSTTSGSGFGSSLTLAQSGGTVAATTIYVRFNRATVGPSTGNIVHTSAFATSQNVFVSGDAGSFALRINTGGPESTYGGNVFVSDQYFDTGKTLVRPQTGLPEPYQSFRYSPSQQMAYDIPLPDGTYTVNLYFAELWFGATGGVPGGAGKRVFDVRVEGQLVEDDLDVFAEVGAERMLVKTHTVNVTGGVLDIDFSSLAVDGGIRHPTINAIEVLGSRPDPLLADKQANSLSLSPNPATNNITASFERPIKVKTIMVFDMIGRLVRTYKPEEVKNGDGYGLDLNFIQPGSYIIKTIDEQGNQFQKQMAIDY